MALQWNTGSAQIGALPTADATQEGKIFQYTGETDTNFTNGYFYECVEVTPATDPKTYEWKQKNVQDGGGSGSGNADFTLDTANDFAVIQSQTQGMSFDLSDADGVTIIASDPGTYQNTKKLSTLDYVDGIAGDLTTLTTTDKTSLVKAINEVYEKSGEPFKVIQWTGDPNKTIPVCTQDIGNTQIDKLTFTTPTELQATYQIVGMIAYEVFDAVTNGQRINCWPVCQFTGQNQTELGVRFMCAGTQPKQARRISAWILLKHR